MIPLAKADIALEADENEYYSRAAAYNAILRDATRGHPIESRNVLQGYGGGTFPPVHPLYLSLSLFVGEGATFARWAVVLLSSLTTPLVYLLTLLCSTRKAALAAAGVHAVYPSLVAFSHYLWSETTYIFFLVLATCLVVRLLEADTKTRRAAYALAAGCCLALAALTRAAGLPFLLAIPAWTFFSSRKTAGAVSATALIVVASAIVLLPWEVYMFSREGRLVPLSTAAGYNLLLGNNPWESGERFEPDAKPKVVAAIQQYAETHGVPGSEAARVLAIQEIARSPMAFLERCFQKLRIMWTADRFIFRHVLHAVYPPMKSGTVIVLWCVVAFSLFAAVGLAVWGFVGVDPPLRHRGLLLTLVTIGIVPPLITVSDSRSSLPLIALVLPAMGHALAHIRQPQRSRVTVVFTVAVVGLLVLNVVTFQIGRRASSKTSSFYYPLVRSVDRLTGSDTPFTDRISLRVDDPGVEGEIRINLLSDGYRFHVTGTRRRVWSYSAERAELTLNIYAHRPTEPLRMRLYSKPVRQSVIVEPIGEDSWRQWRPSGVRGLDYRWRGGGPPPPNRPAQK